MSLAMLAAFIRYVVLLTLSMQQVRGYSPLEIGLAYLPLGVGIGVGMGVATGLMPRIGVKTALLIGFLGSGAGLLTAAQPCAGLVQRFGHQAAYVLPPGDPAIAN